MPPELPDWIAKFRALNQRFNDAEITLAEWNVLVEELLIEAELV